MKKNLLLCFALILLCFSVSSVFAQTDEEGASEEPSLSERFSSFRFHDRFEDYQLMRYYRFSPDVQFFDSIDLSYFPHEKWNKTVWALLGRWAESGTYNQIIYTDTPFEKMLIHGTDTGERRGFLRDFYLYTTLFVEDNYPQDTGSCYIYFSDSLLIGLNESKGLLIDPESGIYEATNSYGGVRHTTYTPNTIRHNLELIHELNPDYYQIDPDKIEASSIGASEYPREDLDAQFLRDWETLKGSFRMTDSPEVKAYRVEIVRENGISTIYINGREVYYAEDNLKTLNAEGDLVPERVSWTYGPMLYPGGLTVTCSLGDLMIYGPRSGM